MTLPKAQPRVKDFFVLFASREGKGRRGGASIGMGLRYWIKSQLSATAGYPIQQLKLRKGAITEHVPQEQELRVEPDDIKIVRVIKSNKTARWLRGICKFAKPTGKKDTALKSWLRRIIIASYEEYENIVLEKAQGNPYPFRKWFDQNGRVYIPFKAVVNPSHDDKDVMDFLQLRGYKVVDYAKGLCQPASGGNQQKIGRVLQSFLTNIEKAQHEGKPYFEDVDYVREMIKNFNTSQARAGGKGDYSIVISQNPKDVAMMSTDRGWTSCMELGKGSHHQDVFCEVAEGGLVAYLIKSSDMEITKPAARIHIRRFDDSFGRSLAIPEDAVYGTDVPGFKEAVKSWLDRQQTGMPGGLYMRRGGEYSDTFGKSMVVLPRKEEEVVQWLRKQVDAPTPWVVEDQFDEEQAPNYHGRKIFKNEKEARDFVAENDSSFEREEMDEIEGNSDEPRWSEEDESGNYVMKRFTVTPERRDYADMMADEAALEIMANPNKYATTQEGVKQLLEEVKDYVFSKKELVYSTLSDQFIKQYPQFITEDDASKFNEEKLIKWIESLPEEQKEGPRNNFKAGLIKDAALGWISFDDGEIKEALQRIEERKIAGVEDEMFVANDDLAQALFRKIYDVVLNPASRVFDKKIPADLSSAILRIPSILQSKLGENYNDQVKDRVEGQIVHVLGLAEVDTPEFVRLIATIIPRLRPSIYRSSTLISAPRLWQYIVGHLGKKSSGVDLTELGIPIANIGRTAMSLVPLLEEKQGQISAIYENLINGITPEQISQNNWNAGSLEDYKVRLENCAIKDVRNYDYVIDSIKKGQLSDIEFVHWL